MPSGGVEPPPTEFRRLFTIMEGCRRPKEAVMLRCSGAGAAPALEQLTAAALERVKSAGGRLCELQGHSVGKRAGDNGWGRALRNEPGATPTSPFRDKRRETRMPRDPDFTGRAYSANERDKSIECAMLPRQTRPMTSSSGRIQSFHIESLRMQGKGTECVGELEKTAHALAPRKMAGHQRCASCARKARRDLDAESAETCRRPNWAANACRPKTEGGLMHRPPRRKFHPPLSRPRAPSRTYICHIWRSRLPLLILQLSPLGGKVLQFSSARKVRQLAHVHPTIPSSSITCLLMPITIPFASSRPTASSVSPGNKTSAFSRNLEIEHGRISSSRLRNPLNEFVTDSQGALRGILSTESRSGQYRAIEYDELAPLDWLLQYLLAADGFLIQSHAINFICPMFLQEVLAGSKSPSLNLFPFSQTEWILHSFKHRQELGRRSTPPEMFKGSVQFELFSHPCPRPHLESLRTCYENYQVVYRIGDPPRRISYASLQSLKFLRQLFTMVHRFNFLQLSGSVLSLAVIPPPAQLLIKLPQQLPPRMNLSRLLRPAERPPKSPTGLRLRLCFRLRLRLRISGSESQAPRLKLPRVDSILGLGVKTQSRLALKTRTRSAPSLELGASAAQSLFTCLLVPGAGPFPGLAGFGIGIGIDSFARARRGARARRRRCALGPQALKPSLTQDSAPPKYTFILAPHAPRMTRLGLGRDSDTRTEEKGKSMYWAWACTNMWTNAMHPAGVRVRGRIRVMMRRTEGKRRRGCAYAQSSAEASTGSATRDDADPGSESTTRRRAGVEYGGATTMCAEEMCGPSAGHSASTPPQSRHRASSASSPTPTAVSAPTRHATPAQHEGGGRKERTRAKELEERRKTTHRVLPIAIPAGPALNAPGPLVLEWAETGIGGGMLGVEPLLPCVRTVVEAAEDGADEGVLCLVSLSFKEEDSCRTSPKTPNTPPTPPRRRKQNAHQRLRLMQPCFNHIDGPLGWAALPAGVQEPARTAQSRRARRDEASALGRAGEGRARGGEGGGLSGVERGEGCVRVFGVHVGGGRGGGRGVHVVVVVVVVGGRGRRRRRAVVVVRKTLRHGQAHRRPEDEGERDEGEGACGDEEEGARAAEERGCGSGRMGMGRGRWLGGGAYARWRCLCWRSGGVGVGGGRCWRRRGIPIRIIAAANHPAATNAGVGVFCSSSSLCKPPSTSPIATCSGYRRSIIMTPPAAFLRPSLR
ncbi:hypothetical protein DFH09DRAFT_1499645 [Mycena vulgaris]|nr:hypothetical protein DFH09DRAFT_1499645 [Mycena vulgaris]